MPNVSKFLEEVKNGVIIIWNNFYKLPVFWSNSIKSFRMKASKMVKWWVTKNRKLLRIFGDLKKDWWLVPGSFCFYNNFHKKIMGLKTKMKLDFRGFLIIIQKISWLVCQLHGSKDFKLVSYRCAWPVFRPNIIMRPPSIFWSNKIKWSDYQ